MVTRERGIRGSERRSVLGPAPMPQENGDRDSRFRSITRRRLVGAAAGVAGAAGAAALVGGPADGRAQTPGADAAGWSFTDDAGETIALPARPTRVVAFSTHASALADFGVTTVGTWSYAASNPEALGDDFFGRLDLASQQVVGTTDGRIDVEKLIVAEPDLIVTTETDLDLDALGAVAPVAIINLGGSTDTVVARMEELAVALGADPASPEIVAAKEQFTAALEELGEILSASDGVSALFVFAGEAELYVANPPAWEQIAVLVKLGLDVVAPDVEEGMFWETLSWEQALKYDSDVLFQSSIASALTPEELTDHPLMGRHPAVEAGQIGLWNNEYIRSYQGAVIILNNAIDGLRDARSVE